MSSSFVLFWKRNIFLGEIYCKITIFFLKWNLLPWIIQKAWIWWVCSFVFFCTRNFQFGKIWSKKPKLCDWNKTWRLTNLNMRILCWILCWFLLSSVLDQKFSPKMGIVCLWWNLMSWLIHTCWICWWYAFALFWTRNAPSSNLCSKNQKCMLKMIVGT